MLTWEKTLIRDFQGIFLAKADRLEVIPTSVNSARYQFTDGLIQNKEVRVIRNNSGKIIFLYAFTDRNTLVFTTNEATFKEVLTRLVKGRVTR